MSKPLVAKATTTIDVPVATVWEALVTPEIIKKYMFGSHVTSHWHEGDSITWKGDMNGKAYLDKGKILKVIPNKLLEYTHYSSMSDSEDIPENYHTLVYELDDQGEHTHVSLSQDNNATDEERDHSQKMWEGMLKGLKELLEK